MLWTALLGATAAGRPQFVGVSQANSSSSTVASTTISVPAGVQNGDLLIAVTLADGAVDWTQAGFTWALEHIDTPSIGIAHRFASSEPGSYTFSASSSRRLGGQIMAFRGASWDTVGAVGLGSAYTASGITIQSSDSILVGVFCANGANRVWGAPAGMSEVSKYEGSNPGFATYRQDVDSGPTGTRQASLSGTGVNAAAAVLFSIKPA